MFVLYLQNSFCKPLQISQIEYSDGASICLLFSLLLFSLFMIFLVYFFDVFHSFLYFLIFHLFIMLFHFWIIFLSCLQNPWILLSERQVQHAAKHKKSIEKSKENDEKWIENDERWTIPWFKKMRKTSDKKKHESKWKNIAKKSLIRIWIEKSIRQNQDLAKSWK